MKSVRAWRVASQDSQRHCAACGAEVTHAPLASDDPLIGTVLASKYRLIELIGAGAMGRVYRAEHLHLASPVAVKVLSPELASRPPDHPSRFHHEARAAWRLRHPNAIRVHDFGEAETDCSTWSWSCCTAGPWAKSTAGRARSPRRGSLAC